jgi:hypothetical protein
MLLDPIGEANYKILMENRGYDHSYTIKNEQSIIGMGFIRNYQLEGYPGEINIHANLNFSKSEPLLTLEFVGLKMFMYLSTGEFDPYHPNFYKIEQTLIKYALRCLRGE